MKTHEKRAFVVRLIANVQADILAQVPEMPTAWDGTHLRRLIAERFARVAPKAPKVAKAARGRP